MNKRTLRLKQAFIAISGLVLAFSGTAMVAATSIEELGRQIQKLEDKVQRGQHAINALNKEQNTLENKVAALNARINDATDRIRLTQLKIDNLEQQIDKAQKELDHQKFLLAENLKALYKKGNVTTIELLASSENFTQYINQQEYLQRIKIAIQEAADKVEALKAELEEKSAEQAKLLKQQKLRRQELNESKREKQQILAYSRGEEARYQRWVASNDRAASRLRAEQAALIAAERGGGSYGPGTQGNGGYPSEWAPPVVQDSKVDSWGFYNRECTSYAAWKRAAIGRPIPAWGYQYQPANAKNWIDIARAEGYRVDRDPEVGAIAVWPVGAYGHVMIVEDILNGGSSVRVSDYNSDFNGYYSADGIWSVSSLYFIH